MVWLSKLEPQLSKPDPLAKWPDRPVCSQVFWSKLIWVTDKKYLVVTLWLNLLAKSL
jgi:hypothetical protein